MQIQFGNENIRRQASEYQGIWYQKIWILTSEFLIIK